MDSVSLMFSRDFVDWKDCAIWEAMRERNGFYVRGRDRSREYKAPMSSLIGDGPSEVVRPLLGCNGLKRVRCGGCKE